MEVEKRELELYEDVVNPFFAVELNRLDKESTVTAPISTTEFDEVKEKNSKLAIQNVALQKNISCLYKTARLEIERKDSMIKDLRERINVLESDAQLGPQMLYQQYMVSCFTSGQVDALAAAALQPSEDIGYITNINHCYPYPNTGFTNCNSDVSGGFIDEKVSISVSGGTLGVSDQECSKALASSSDAAPLVKALVEKGSKIDSETFRTSCVSQSCALRTKCDAGGNSVEGMDTDVSGRDVLVKFANGESREYDSEDSTTWNIKSDLQNDFMPTVSYGQHSRTDTSSETARESVHPVDYDVKKKCEVKRKCSNPSKSVNENEMVLRDLRGKDLGDRMSEKKRHELQHCHRNSRDHHRNHTFDHKSRSSNHYHKSCDPEKDRSDRSRRGQSKHGLGHPRVLDGSISPNGSITPKSKYRKLDLDDGSVDVKSRHRVRPNRSITPIRSHHRRGSSRSLQEDSRLTPHREVTPRSHHRRGSSRSLQEDSRLTPHREVTPRSHHREVTPRSMHRELSPQSCHRGGSPGSLHKVASPSRSRRSMHREATPKTQCKAGNPKVQRDVSPEPQPRTTTPRSQHIELTPKSQCSARTSKLGCREQLPRSQHRMPQHREVSPGSQYQRVMTPGSQPIEMNSRSQCRTMSHKSQHRTVSGSHHRELSPRSQHKAVSRRSQHRTMSPRPQHRELSPRSLQQVPSRLQRKQSRECARKRKSTSPHSRQEGENRPNDRHKKRHTVNGIQYASPRPTLSPHSDKPRSNSKSVLNQKIAQSSFDFPVQDSALHKCGDDSSEVTLGSLEDLFTTIEFDNVLEESKSKELQCSTAIDVCQSHKDKGESFFLRSDSCSALSLSDSEDDEVLEECNDKQTMVVSDSLPCNQVGVRLEDELHSHPRSIVSDTLNLDDSVGCAVLQLSSACDNSFQGDSVSACSTFINTGAHNLDLSVPHNLDPSRPNSPEHTDPHSLNLSVSNKDVDSSSVQMQDSSFQQVLDSYAVPNKDSSGAHNLDSSGAHNLDSSGAHNLDSSGAHNQDSSGAHNQDSSGTYNQDSSGAHNLDSSGAHNLDSSGAHNLDSFGAHNQDSSGAHNLDSSGAHNQDSSSAHNLDSSGAHNQDSSGAHNQDSSGAHNLDSSGAHNQDSSGAHNLDSSGAHNLDSSGAHNLDSSGAHNHSSGAHNLDSSGAHNLDSSGTHNLDSSGAHNLDSSGAHNLDSSGAHNHSSGAHNQDSSGAHNLDSSGAHNLDSSGAHNLDSSGAHNLDSSGAHNLDSSGAHNLDSSGAHNLDSSGAHNHSSGAHNLDSSGAHNLDSSGAHNLDSSGTYNHSSGAHNLDSSGAHNLDSSGTYNLDSSGAHNLDSSCAHNLDSSCAHNLDSSGAHNLDSSCAHNLDSSGAHNLDSSGAHNLDSSGTYNLHSSCAQILQDVASPISSHKLDSSTTTLLDSTLTSSTNIFSHGRTSLGILASQPVNSSSFDLSNHLDNQAHYSDSSGSDSDSEQSSSSVTTHQLDSPVILDSPKVSSGKLLETSEKSILSKEWDSPVKLPRYMDSLISPHTLDSADIFSDSVQWGSPSTSDHPLDTPRTPTDSPSPPIACINVGSNSPDNRTVSALSNSYLAHGSLYSEVTVLDSSDNYNILLDQQKHLDNSHSHPPQMASTGITKLLTTDSNSEREQDMEEGEITDSTSDDNDGGNELMLHSLQSDLNGLDIGPNTVKSGHHQTYTSNDCISSHDRIPPSPKHHRHRRHSKTASYMYLYDKQILNDHQHSMHSSRKESNRHANSHEERHRKQNSPRLQSRPTHTSRKESRHGKEYASGHHQDRSRYRDRSPPPHHHHRCQRERSSVTRRTSLQSSNRTSN